MHKRLLFCFLFLCGFCQAQTDTTVLYPALAYKHTSLPFRSFVDMSGHSSNSIPADSVFTAPAQLKLVAGFTPYPVWLRFTLLPPASASPTSPARYMAQLTNWYLDEVDFYVPDGRGGYAVARAGDHLPFVQRPVQTRFPTVEIPLTRPAPATVYVRIRSTQHINLALNLSTPAAFGKQTSSDLTSFTLGLSAMRLLLHLALLFFLFRNSRFRAYNLLGLSICLMYLVSGGNSNVLFPASPFWANALFFLASALLPVSFCYYVGTLYTVRKHFPYLRPLGWLVFLICGTYAFAHLFFSHAYLSQSFAVFFALIMTGLTLLVLAGYWRGIRPSVWYLTPLFIYLIMAALYYAQNTRLYGQAGGPMSVLLQQESLRISMLIDFLFMPFLVAMMLRQAYRSRHEARRQAEANELEQKKLATLDKLKTRFFTNLSHEFRTPLSLLLGPIDDLRRRFPDNAEYENMHRNAHRLLTLINQLLDMAKMDIGQLELNLQPGDLAADVRGWIASSESLAQNRGIALAIHQNETAWPARYDADKLERVVTNLLANALKYTNRGGTIRLETIFDASGMTLRVSDNGMGIPPKKLPTVFDRFQQKPPRPEVSPVDALYEGSGVGLALVRELVELLQGSIGVASLVGEGTTFTVWVPLESIDPSSPQPDTPPATPAPGSLTTTPKADTISRPPHLSLSAQEPPKLLFVSPDPALRAEIRAVLSGTHILREAADCREGHALSLVWTPDLIVTDLSMPRLDGIDLCARLRQDSRTDHIPVVELINPGLPPKGEDENGADEYLTKPVDPVILLVRLQQLYQQQNAVRIWLSQQLLDNPDIVEPPAVPGRHKRRQQAFMTLLYSHLDRHLDKVQFAEERLALEMAMDCQALNRKLNALVGMNTNEVIRTYRLRRAAKMLQQGVAPAETACKVGFESPSHFINAFRAYFQQSPSSFIEQL